MKRKASILSVLVTAILLAVNLSARAQGTGPAAPATTMSADEQKLVAGISSAVDPAAKVKGAGELVNKFPKTTVRGRLAADMADQVASVKDNAKKLLLAQDLQKIFSQPAEAEAIGPVVVQAYADANQPDGAFAQGAVFLAQAPDAVPLLVQLTAIGTDLVKKQNGKFVLQTIQYAEHALQLIEAKKTSAFEDLSWLTYKSQVLPGLYQSLGMLYLAKGDRVEAVARYKKASELAPTDAFNFVMLASLADSEYQDEAKRYQSMAAGAARDEQLKKVQGQMDSTIDAYARAIALSEGNATLQDVRQQYLQDLESYYKYRHNGSAEGMQDLINKYKTAAKP
jgi:tetratricopeptide (TPR) repeat protein